MTQIFTKYPDHHDGRRSITEKDRENVRKLVKSGTTQSEIVKRLGISFSTINRIVNKKIKNNYVKYAKDNWKKYYDKDAHRDKMRRYRAKKRLLGYTKNI